MLYYTYNKELTFVNKLDLLSENIPSCQVKPRPRSTRSTNENIQKYLKAWIHNQPR